MKTARMIGNFAEHRIADLGISQEEVNNTLQLSEPEVMAFYKGRLLLTYDQLTELSNLLKVPVQDIIKGDEQEYSVSVVHCMNDFDHESNREFILDIIDDYLDIWDSIPLT